MIRLFSIIFNRFKDALSESGMALVAAIYVMLILSMVGVSVLVIASNDGRGIAQNRQSGQSLAVAESGAEYAIWLLRTPPTSGGKGKTWVTATPEISINQALAENKYESFPIRDANGVQSGMAKIIVQRRSGNSTNERRVTSIGQQCLNADCSNLSDERVVQTVVEIVSVPGPFYNYALFYNSTATNASMRLEDLWMSGGAYAGHGQNVIFNHIEVNGHIYAHENIELNCGGGTKTTMAYGKNMYTFKTIQNKTNCLFPTTSAYENYNSGTHDDTFPEVTTQVWNNRAWYRANSDKFYPPDAGTNTSANEDRAFCSDANGNIKTSVGLSSDCPTAGTLVTDSTGAPFEFGMIFVAGKVKVHGTFKGQITFIAGGSNEAAGGAFPQSGADLYIGDKDGTDEGDGTDDLRSLRTPDGVTKDVNGKEPGECQNGIDPVAGGTDSIGLVGADVLIDSGDTPCFIRAIFWAKNDINFTNSCSDCPPRLEIHATILEVSNQLSIRGGQRNLHLYYDDGLIESMPPGMQGEVSLSVARKSYQEILMR